jgi:hypothetical protein
MNNKKKASTAVAKTPQKLQASEASHEKTPGRSQVFSSPSGGLSHGDRSGGTQYAELLGEVKQRIRHAQARAWMAVNAELIRLYWRIGQVIDHRQQQEGYGTAVIPRLARDLHNELPEEKGFSERNIKRMLAFYRLYPHAALDSELVPQPVAQVSVDPAVAGALPGVDFSAPLLLAMPWGHHAVLMDKVKDAAAR